MLQSNIELGAGMTVAQALSRLILEADSMGTHVFAHFNGRIITSRMSIDDAFREVTGSGLEEWHDEF